VTSAKCATGRSGLHRLHMEQLGPHYSGERRGRSRGVTNPDRIASKQMRAFFRTTLPLLLVAGALAGITGYAYGVHSARPAVSASERMRTSANSIHPHDDSVLKPPPSWRHWPSLTDF